MALLGLVACLNATDDRQETREFADGAREAVEAAAPGADLEAVGVAGDDSDLFKPAAGLPDTKTGLSTRDLTAGEEELENNPYLDPEFVVAEWIQDGQSKFAALHQRLADLQEEYVGVQTIRMPLTAAKDTFSKDDWFAYDTYLAEWSSSTNFGGDTLVYAGAFYTFWEDALLRNFYCPGRPVLNATLYINISENWLAYDEIYYIRGLAAAWDENGVTWDNAPAATGTASATYCYAGWTGWDVYDASGPVVDVCNNGYTNYGLTFFSNNYLNNDIGFLAWEIDSSPQSFLEIQYFVPAADQCANAATVAVPSNTAGDTTSAYPDYAGSCGGATGRELVYQFSGTADVLYIVNLQGASGFDTLLYVRTGDCGTGTEIGCNDDFGQTNQSQLIFVAPTTGTYYAFVDGYSASSYGTFNLAVGACGGCFISQQCYNQGATNPTNLCQICNPNLSRTGWSNNDGVTCWDGVYCNGADTCSGGSCSQHAGDPCPEDNNVCNGITSCNETNDRCDTTTAPNCDDGNVCTTDGCLPVLGCQHVNNASPCNDGLYCNGVDTCSEGACAHAGDPCPENSNVCDGITSCNEDADRCDTTPALDCDDGNICTTDGCLPVLGCQHVNNTITCDDGDICTDNDTCSGGACAGVLNPSRYLHLLSPAGVVSIPGGTESQITWDYGTCPMGHYSSVKITASINGGGNYPVVIDDAAPDTGSYIWTAPALDTPTVRLKIEAGTGSDTTDNNVYIYMPSNLTIAYDAPTGDVTLVWTGGHADIYSLEGNYDDDPASWTRIAEDVSSPWIDADASFKDQVYYRLTNAGGSAFYPSAVGKIAKSLSYGFNLIALPFEPQNTPKAQDLLNLMNADGDNVRSLMGWNSGEQSWNIHYDVYPNYNNFDLDSAQGYFVEVLTPMDWIVYGPVVQEPLSLYLGYDYTLTGFPTGQWAWAQDALEAILDQGGLSTMLFRWLAGEQMWDVHYNLYPDYNNFAVVLGAGYFIKNDAPVDFRMNPLHISESNVSHSGFQVTFETPMPTTAGLRFGTSPGALINYVVEDWATLFQSKTTHTIVVSGQAGGTIYYDLLVSNKVFNNRGAHYQVTLP